MEKAWRISLAMGVALAVSSVGCGDSAAPVSDGGYDGHVVPDGAADADVDAEVDAAVDAAVEVDADVDAAVEVDADVDAAVELDAGVDAAIEIDAGVDADAGADADAGPSYFTVTVTLAGGGTGSVTSAPAGIACGSDCTEDYLENTSVTLTATAATGALFDGWSGGGCSGTAPCTVLVVAATDVTATFSPKQYNYAFISPVAHDAALGGLSGADSLCEGWAASAGIPGVYRAMLSTSTENASTRLGTARGWIRPDGAPVADLPSELFGSAGPLAPVLITADGTNLGAQSVWSGSRADGTYAVAGATDCSGWTSASAALTAWHGFSQTTAEWIDRGIYSDCSQLLYVYCFQVDHTTPLVVSDFAETGRVIFVSTGTFDVTSGLAGADAVCTANASTVPALSGRTFRALLASDGTSAASRFTSTTSAIVRVDGLRVAADFSALTVGTLVHPANLRANGSAEPWRVFVGADSPTALGTAAFTCAGWTSTAGNATEGTATSTMLGAVSRSWFGGTSGPCASHTNFIPVYCLEE